MKKDEYDRCVATGLDGYRRVLLKNVDPFIDNKCKYKSYDECRDMRGNRYDFEGQSYTCTPAADKYTRKNSDGTCPDDYENTSDTGYTNKRINHPGIPSGCRPKAECGSWGCWYGTKCTTDPSHEDIKDEIPLCKKNNIYGIVYNNNY